MWPYIVTELVDVSGAGSSCHNQPNRWPRCTHADLYFRAHRHPFYMVSKRFDQKSISFVTTIKPDFFAQETEGDTDTDKRWRGAFFFMI